VKEIQAAASDGGRPAALLPRGVNLLPCLLSRPPDPRPLKRPVFAFETLQN